MSGKKCREIGNIYVCEAGDLEFSSIFVSCAQLSARTGLFATGERRVTDL